MRERERELCVWRGEDVGSGTSEHSRTGCIGDVSKLRLMESLAALSARSSAGTRRPYANTHRNTRLATRRAGVHHSRGSSPSSGKLAGNLLGWGGGGDCFLFKRDLFSLWKSLPLHEYCAIGGE